MSIEGGTCNTQLPAQITNIRFGLAHCGHGETQLSWCHLGLATSLRPRARADASPARVRSEIRSRSNSASDAKMPKTSLPAGVVVSIAAPWPFRTLRPMLRLVRSCTTFPEIAA